MGERAAADPLLFGGQVSVLTAATALDEAALLWAGTADWCIPTLVLHGTADTYTDPHASRAFEARVAAEDKTLSLIHGGHHELLNDVCADDVLGLVLDWLDAHV